MVWPPQSPDLNPIEQVWDLIDRKIPKGRRSSQEQMWKYVQHYWNQVTNNELRLYIDSMPRRCQAVIDAKGRHTKY